MIGPEIPQEFLNKKLIHVKKYGQNTLCVQEFSGLIDFHVTEDVCTLQVQGQSLRESLELEISNYHIQIVNEDFMLKLKEKDGFSQIEIYFSALDYFTEFVTDLLKQNQVIEEYSDVEMENEPQDLPLPTQENLLNFHRNLLCELPNFLIHFSAQPEIYMKALIESFKQNIADMDGELIDLSFQIAKNMYNFLVFCNDEEVIDILIEDQYFIPVLQMLEHCPNRSQKLHEKSYSQLYQDCIYKELFPMKKEIADLIHKNFRLKFINDVALAQFIQLEEFSFNILTHMIDQNNVRVIKLIMNGERDQIIDIFQNIDVLNESQQKFLTEWINISKSLLFKGKLDDDIFGIMSMENLFKKIISAMQNTSTSIYAIQLFLQILNYMSYVEIDSFLHLCQQNNIQFWKCLFDSFIKIDVSIMEEISNIVNRIFFQLQSQEQKVEFFQSLKLYFLEPLSKQIQNQLRINVQGTQSSLLSEYFDLIVNIYGVLGSHTRNFIISERILRTLQENYSQLSNTNKCLVIKFLHQLLRQKDEIFIKHIRQTDLPKYIIYSYAKLRGGLLQSSILSLISYIKQDEIFIKLYQFMKQEMITLGKSIDLKLIEQNQQIKEEKDQIQVEKQLDSLYPPFEVVQAEQGEFQIALEPKIIKKIHTQK